MQILPKHSAWCMALLLLAAGCGEGSNFFASGDGAADSYPDGRPIPRDESHELTEYLDAGMPAHDRRWSSSDMQEASLALSDITQLEDGQLPRFGSKKSGEVFRRMTSIENLEPYRNTATPIDIRLPEVQGYLQASNKVMKLYRAAFQRNAVSDSDLVELLGAQLRVSAVALGLVSEFLPSMDNGDPINSRRREGLQRIQGSMANVVDETVTTLTDSERYRTSELKRMIGFMVETFPSILPKIPEANRAAAVIRLQGLLKDPKMAHLEPEFATLVLLAEQSVPAQVSVQE